MSDRDKELSNDLLSDYMNVKCYNTRPIDLSESQAVQFAKIDLTNRIELLNKILNSDEIDLIAEVYIKPILQSLENQLTHLNNL